MGELGHVLGADQHAARLRRTQRQFHQIELAAFGLAPAVGLLHLVDRVRPRREEFHHAPRREETVLLFEDEAAHRRAFAVELAALLLAVNDAEDRLRVVAPEVVELADEEFVRRQGNDPVLAGLLDAEETVELVADHGVVAFDRLADVAVLAVPADLDVVERRLVAVDLFEAFDLGAARELGTVFVFDPGQILYRVIDQVGEIVLDLLDFGGDLAEFLLVLFDVESGDPAHRQREEFIHVVGSHVAAQLVAERGESVEDLLVFRLLAFALFDALVDAVLEEDLREGLGVAQFVLPFEFEFQLALQIPLELFDVAEQHLGHAHLHRAVIADHHHLGRDRYRTVGVHVKPAQGLFGVVAAGRGHADLDVVGGEVGDVGDTDLVLLGGLFDGTDQRFGGTAVGDLADHEVAALDLDLGAEDDPAVAVVVLGGVHEPALLEVGEDLETFALERGYFGVEEFVEVVRQYGRGHTDRDTVAAEHQQTRHLRRQHHGFDLAPVVVGHEFRDVVVEERLVGELGQAALGVTPGGGGTSRQNIAEVALLFDVVGRVEIDRLGLAGLAIGLLLLDAAALVGEHDQRVADRGVAVRVVVHGVADDVGDLLRSAVVDKIERPENAPLHGLEAVVDVGDRARTDHVTRVVEEVPVHHLPEVLVGAALLLGDRTGFVFLLRLDRDFREVAGADVFAVTHNRRPPDCS